MNPFEKIRTSIWIMQPQGERGENSKKYFRVATTFYRKESFATPNTSTGSNNKKTTKAKTHNDEAKATSLEVPHLFSIHRLDTKPWGILNSGEKLRKMTTPRTPLGSRSPLKGIYGCFQNIGVFPKSSHFNGVFSIIFTIHFRVPLSLETPIYTQWIPMWYKVCMGLIIKGPPSQGYHESLTKALERRTDKTHQMTKELIRRIMFNVLCKPEEL